MLVCKSLVVKQVVFLILLKPVYVPIYSSILGPKYSQIA